MDNRVVQVLEEDEFDDLPNAGLFKAEDGHAISFHIIVEKEEVRSQLRQLVVNYGGRVEDNYADMGPRTVLLVDEHTHQKGAFSRVAFKPLFVYDCISKVELLNLSDYLYIKDVDDCEEYFFDVIYFRIREFKCVQTPDEEDNFCTIPTRKTPNRMLSPTTLLNAKRRKSDDRFTHMTAIAAASKQVNNSQSSIISVPRSVGSAKSKLSKSSSSNLALESFLRKLNRTPKRPKKDGFKFNKIKKTKMDKENISTNPTNVIPEIVCNGSKEPESVTPKKILNNSKNRTKSKKPFVRKDVIKTRSFSSKYKKIYSKLNKPKNDLKTAIKPKNRQVKKKTKEIKGVKKREEKIKINRTKSKKTIKSLKVKIVKEASKAKEKLKRIKTHKKASKASKKQPIAKSKRAAKNSSVIQKLKGKNLISLKNSGKVKSLGATNVSTRSSQSIKVISRTSNGSTRSSQSINVISRTSNGSTRSSQSINVISRTSNGSTTSSQSINVISRKKPGQISRSSRTDSPSPKKDYDSDFMSDLIKTARNSKSMIKLTRIPLTKTMLNCSSSSSADNASTISTRSSLKKSPLKVETKESKRVKKPQNKFLRILRDRDLNKMSKHHEFSRLKKLKGGKEPSLSLDKKNTSKSKKSKDAASTTSSSSNSSNWSRMKLCDKILRSSRSLKLPNSATQASYRRRNSKFDPPQTNEGKIRIISFVQYAPKR